MKKSYLYKINPKITDEYPMRRALEKDIMRRIKKAVKNNESEAVIYLPQDEPYTYWHRFYFTKKKIPKSMIRSIVDSLKELGYHINENEKGDFMYIKSWIYYYKIKIILDT